MNHKMPPVARSGSHRFTPRLGPRRLLTIVALCLVSVGCGPRWKNVPHGVVSGTGIRIEAADKRFLLESGKPFTPPFEVTPNRDIEFAGEDVTAYGNKVGPRHRVVVYVPGREVPLFGKVMFFKVWSKFDGPASRSYQVQIPESYIEAASGGRLSVVYETYGEGVPFPGGITHKRIAWALWLSDRPF